MSFFEHFSLVHEFKKMSTLAHSISVVLNVFLKGIVTGSVFAKERKPKTFILSVTV